MSLVHHIVAMDAARRRRERERRFRRKSERDAERKVAKSDSAEA